MRPPSPIGVNRHTRGLHTCGATTIHKVVAAFLLVTFAPEITIKCMHKFDACWLAAHKVPVSSLQRVCFVCNFSTSLLAFPWSTSHVRTSCVNMRSDRSVGLVYSE